MLSEWKHWCSLCGNSDETNISLSIKEEQLSSALSDTIQNLLSITMANFDETGPKICTICRELLINFMQFSTKAAKVQEMFTELLILESTNEYQLDLNFVRNKYGLNQIIKTTDISPLPILQVQEDKDLYINKKEKIDTVNTDESKDILFINVDIINPENIKKENILDDLIDNTKQQEQLSTKKPITCEICSKQFLRHSNLTTHLKCAHSIENRKKILKNKKSITCEICSKKFLRQSNLTTHLKYAHSIENRKKIFPCEICGKTLSTQQMLTMHCRTHLPIEERAIHQCPNCEQKLSCEASLKQHIRSKHTDEKTFICDQCGKTFTTKKEMIVHKYVHDTDNEFQCKKCPKIFKNELRLKVHMKVHRDKMYPCSICGLQLKTPKTLKNHLIIHTDEMPFNCNYCGAKFRRDKNLRAHCIIHTGLKPYECPFCSQSYANRSNCKKHQKHSHPEEFAAMQASGIQQYSKNVPKLSQLQTMLGQMKSELQCSPNS